MEAVLYNSTAMRDWAEVVKKNMDNHLRGVIPDNVAQQSPVKNSVEDKSKARHSATSKLKSLEGYTFGSLRQRAINDYKKLDER